MFLAIPNVAAAAVPELPNIARNAEINNGLVFKRFNNATTTNCSSVSPTATNANVTSSVVHGGANGVSVPKVAVGFIIGMVVAIGLSSL